MYVYQLVDKPLLLGCKMGSSCLALNTKFNVSKAGLSLALSVVYEKLKLSIYLLCTHSAHKGYLQ